MNPWFPPASIDAVTGAQTTRGVVIDHAPTVCTVSA